QPRPNRNAPQVLETLRSAARMVVQASLGYTRTPRRARIMRILLALGALAIVLLIAYNALDPVQIERRQNQAIYEAERNRMTLDYQSLDLQRYVATQPARMVNDYAFGAIIIVGG